MEGFKKTTSGLIIPENHKPYPIAFDLFCGCGGFSLGFIKAGFQVIAGFDNDPWAAQTYMCNLGSYPIQIHYTSDKYEEELAEHFEKQFKKQQRKREKEGSNKTIDPQNGWVESEEIILLNQVSGSGWIRSRKLAGEYYPPVTNFFYGDVSEVDGEWILDKLNMKPGDIDVVMGGPPCQGFSKANNKRNVMDPRNSMVFEFARLVTELYPETFVMENVPQIASMRTPEGIPVIDQLCMIFERNGYGKYEALKKSLMHMPDTSGVGTHYAKEKSKSESDSEQKDLFQEASIKPWKT